MFWGQHIGNYTYSASLLMTSIKATLLPRNWVEDISRKTWGDSHGKQVPSFVAQSK